VKGSIALLEEWLNDNVPIDYCAGKLYDTAGFQENGWEAVFPRDIAAMSPPPFLKNVQHDSEIGDRFGMECRVDISEAWPQLSEGCREEDKYSLLRNCLWRWPLEFAASNPVPLSRQRRAFNGA
jgi:hypothetical protein